MIRNPIISATGMQLSLALVMLGGCSESSQAPVTDAKPPNLTDASTDANVSDASSPDATPCLPTQASTWYRDADEDGFGTPDLFAVDCVQPQGFVDNNTDCNDYDQGIYPGATEFCDTLDNDCDQGTEETCPAQCSPYSRDGEIYLFCGLANNAEAVAGCSAQNMTLVIIDNQNEQSWVSNQRFYAYGGNLFAAWMGADDRESEDTWRWADGTNFWIGRGNSGSAVDGALAFWNNGEPNNGDDELEEDCGIISANSPGAWDDRPCAEDLPFICERQF